MSDLMYFVNEQIRKTLREQDYNDVAEAVWESLSNYDRVTVGRVLFDRHVQEIAGATRRRSVREQNRARGHSPHVRQGAHRRYGVSRTTEPFMEQWHFFGDETQKRAKDLTVKDLQRLIEMRTAQARKNDEWAEKYRRLMELMRKKRVKKVGDLDEELVDEVMGGEIEQAR